MECDVLIVGGGPAGLAAAIQGASEGLKVCLLDAGASLGGRAQESSAIENYPMPLGIDSVTGRDLAAGFINQARKFRADLQCPARAVKLINDKKKKVVIGEDYSEFVTKSVILSNGLSYTKLAARNISAFLGRGVYYGMPPAIEDGVKKTVAVVGGANSAGQAALRYARSPLCSVKVLVRSKARMSQYLRDRIAQSSNVELMEGTSISCALGGNRLEQLVMEDGSKMPCDICSIFVGAKPYTQWLDGTLDLDDYKFIKTTGFATSMPGVFACGDVRSGSTKRIATAIGEGAAALQYASKFVEALR